VLREPTEVVGSQDRDEACDRSVVEHAQHSVEEGAALGGNRTGRPQLLELVDHKNGRGGLLTFGQRR
jgi:hypothetical protein